MSKPQIMMPVLLLASLCLLAGCSGKSTPAASTAAPAAPESLASAPPPSGNASQGGGVKLDAPGKVGTPEGGGIKNP